MDYQAILQVIQDLAKSQGYYGRLLEAIQEADEDEIQELKESLEAMEFKDPIDFILWVEQ